MGIGYFKFVLSSLILANNLYFSNPRFTDMLDIDYLVDSPSNRLFSYIFGTVWSNTDMFRLKLLIRHSLLVNCRSNWLACRWIFKINWSCVEAKQISNLIPFRSSGLLCVDRITTFLRQHTFWHTWWDTQSSWQLTTTGTFLWCLMKTYLMRIKMSLVKL